MLSSSLDHIMSDLSARIQHFVIDKHVFSLLSFFFYVEIDEHHINWDIKPQLEIHAISIGKKKNSYAEIAWLGTLFAPNAVHPQDVASGVDLHIVIYRRRSESDFSIVQPKKENKNVNIKVSILLSFCFGFRQVKMTQRLAQFKTEISGLLQQQKRVVLFFGDNCKNYCSIKTRKMKEKRELFL